MSGAVLLGSSLRQGLAKAALQFPAKKLTSYDADSISSQVQVTHRQQTSSEHTPRQVSTVRRRVNFGPPDWMPFGSDRAQKYRDDAKPLTLSHDALLVTLVSPAPSVLGYRAVLGRRQATDAAARNVLHVQLSPVTQAQVSGLRHEAVAASLRPCCFVTPFFVNLWSK